MGNVSWTFTVVNTGKFSYGPTSGTKQEETVESRTGFTTASVGKSVQFDAPWGAMTQYGTGASSVPTFVVQSKGNTAVQRSVKVVSLLGEVVVE